MTICVHTYIIIYILCIYLHICITISISSVAHTWRCSHEPWLFYQTRSGAGVGDTEVAKCHNGKPAVVKVKHDSWQAWQKAKVKHCLMLGMASCKTYKQLTNTILKKCCNHRHDLVHESWKQSESMMDGMMGFKSVDESGRSLTRHFQIGLESFLWRAYVQESEWMPQTNKVHEDLHI